MNPRRFTQFLRGRFGLFLVFVAALFIGVWFFGRHQMRDRQVARMAPQAGTHVDLGQVSEPLGRGLEGGVPRRAAVRRSAEGGIVPFNPPAASAKVAKGATEVPPKPKKVRYESLLASYEAPAVGAPVAPPPPKRFMPFGTLLKCKLVNTVDSADIETPVIALLLEDVWQDGELVIPANTLVHGTARAGRIRDRINASGTWRFVWQNGRELAFSGIALDREYDQDVDGYGITDGSGGLKGRVMATDDFQELKMLAAAAMSGFAQGPRSNRQWLRRHDSRLRDQWVVAGCRHGFPDLRPAHPPGHPTKRLLCPGRRRKGVLRLCPGDGGPRQSQDCRRQRPAGCRNHEFAAAGQGDPDQQSQGVIYA